MTDIQTLFARDPLDLTDDDISEIVAEFRAKRHQFLAAPSKAKAAKPAAIPQDLTGLLDSLV